MSRFGKINWILIAILLVVILGLLIALLAVMDNGQTPDQPQGNPTESNPSVQTGALVIENIEEQDDAVVVTTNYFQVTYPYAFSDLVQVEQINSNEKTALRFYAVINEKRAELYELVLGNQGKTNVGTLMIDGKAVAVTANFYQPADDLNEDGRIAFVAALETFHDVAVSMEENVHFTPAE